MSFDHVYMYLVQDENSWRENEKYDGTAAYYGTAYDFSSRFVTHICMPGFQVLMGASMYFLMESKNRQTWSEKQVLFFFLLRGCLLWALEIVPIGYPTLWYLWGQIAMATLSSLGWCMMLSSFCLILYKRSKQVVFYQWTVGDFFISFLILLFLGLTEFSVRMARAGYDMNPLFLPLCWNNPFPACIIDPFFAWLPVCLFGFFYAQWISKNHYQKILRWSIFCFLCFIFLRFMWMYNVFDFGNFRQKETSDAASAYIFFELSKYPPSLTFLAFTLGANFLLLYIFHQLVNVLHNTLIANILLAFGRSSLFFLYDAFFSSSTCFLTFS